MKTKHVLLLVLALIGASFFCGRLSTLKPRNDSNELISHLNDTIRVYEAKIAGVRQTIYERETLVATLEQAVEAGVIEQDRLRALSIRRATQITRVSGKLRAARDSIELNPQIITDTILVAAGEAKNPLPLSFTYEDEYLLLTAGINKDKTGHFDLVAPSDFVITLSDRNSKSVSILTSPSPYIDIVDYRVVYIKDDPWYARPWIKWVGGGATGLGVGYLLWGR